MRWVSAVVAVGGLAAVARLAATRVTATLDAHPTPMSPYREAQWWLDYDAGFVRRGLPGEVLTWVAGGPPDRAFVAAAGTTTALAAGLAVVALAVRLARTAPAPDRLLVAAVVVASPLAAMLLLQDVGRYDALGVLALALLAAGPGWGRLPRWGAAAAAALVLAAATAAQDLLLPVLAPAALARSGALRGRVGALRGRSGALRGRVGLGAAVLAPGTAVGAASALLPPPPTAVPDARSAALAAGVPHQGGWGDALDAVDRSLVENVSFFQFFEPAAVAWSALLWAGLYAATVVLLAPLLGRARDGLWWALAGWQATCAVALSLVGVDFRRWWGLALLGLVAAAALTAPAVAEPAPRRARLPLVAAVAALLATGLQAAALPVYPVVPLG